MKSSFVSSHQNGVTCVQFEIENVQISLKKEKIAAHIAVDKREIKVSQKYFKRSTIICNVS